MASFADKKDYYSMTANSAPLEVITDDDGASNGYNEYVGQNGALIDDIAYGAKLAPSNSLLLTDDWTIAADTIKLGGVSTLDNKKFVLEELDIDTNAGELPKISVSGKEVQAGAATKRYFAVPAVTIANDESAQILWDAFTLAGTGCHLQSAKYKLKANVPTSDKNGLPLAFGVSRGVIECSIEITQCDSTEPTLTAGTGWTISQKLKCSNPDSDCPTWTATLRHFITLTVPSTSSSSS